MKLVGILCIIYCLSSCHITYATRPSKKINAAIFRITWRGKQCCSLARKIVMYANQENAISLHSALSKSIHRLKKQKKQLEKLTYIYPQYENKAQASLSQANRNLAYFTIAFQIT